MQMRWIKLLVALTLMFVSSVSYSQQYYKWVDEHGVTHYSEALPNENIDHVAFEFPEQYATVDAEKDYYSIQNQLQRMLERKKLQREAQPRSDSSAVVPPQPPIYPYDQPRYIVGPLHRQVYYPHIKNKFKHNCKYTGNCVASKQVPSRGIYQNRSSSNSTGRAAKRGIHSGIVSRPR